jgi:hypothetical protein
MSAIGRVLALTTAGLLLAGCGSAAHHAEAKPRPTASATYAQDPLNSATPVRNNPSIARGIAVTSCVQTRSGWRAVGTARNLTHKNEAIALSIGFTNSGGTLLKHVTVRLSLPANADQSWSVAASFQGPSDITCLVLGAR